MKLSLAWIFDHINADWSSQDIETIVSKFNKTTAEIEHFYEVNYDFSKFILAKVLNSSSDAVVLGAPEPGKDLVLSSRGSVSNDEVYMLTKEKDAYRWSTCKDFGLDKDGYLSNFSVSDELLAGGWRKQVEEKDVILVVDNKSITHRPDMWGHRGFAREIAAFMDLQLLKPSEFLDSFPVREFNVKTSLTEGNPFIIENNAPKVCHRFSGIYFPKIQNQPSDLKIAMRLMRVGSRSINALVDITNYVMFDWSQPTHIFDADKIEDKRIIIRMANKGEKLTLLDEKEIELTKEDLVIANAKEAVALGGVMGGKDGSLTNSTKSVFLESANFDFVTIRRTAFRHKCRTEASSRFEKTLNPAQATEGIKRFIKLLKNLEIDFTVSDEIVAVGVLPGDEIISVSHDYLEKRAGFAFKESEVIEPLERLGFIISPVEGKYDITIPRYRASKDIKNKEDILEEVVRFYGFDKIDSELPAIVKKPSNIKQVANTRKLKQCLVSGASMQEQQNYAFYDESFLELIEYKPKENLVELQNPISENYFRMIGSLIPGLLKNVQDNFVSSERLNFFELGRVWSVVNQSPTEIKMISGIFFSKRETLNFYEYKDRLQKSLDFFDIDAIWKKITPNRPWFSEHQTAEIVVDNKSIGVVGKANAGLLSKLDCLPESDAVIFEIDADFILNFEKAVSKFQPISKFQEVSFDLSSLVPLTLPVSDIETALGEVDASVIDIALIDFFERDDWTDKRSVTFRLKVSSFENTLEKGTIEEIRSKAIKAIERLGGSLRV